MISLKTKVTVNPEICISMSRFDWDIAIKRSGEFWHKLQQSGVKVLMYAALIGSVSGVVAAVAAPNADRAVVKLTSLYFETVACTCPIHLCQFGLFQAESAWMINMSKECKVNISCNIRAACLWQAFLKKTFTLEQCKQPWTIPDGFPVHLTMMRS